MNVNVQGLGILLPVQRGNTGYFNQGFSVLDQAKSNLMNLILTRKGERVMIPDFGCDIHKVVFEPMTPNSLADIKGSVMAAVKTWMPSVNILDISITQDDNANQVNVSISFNVVSNPALIDTVSIQF